MKQLHNTDQGEGKVYVTWYVKQFLRATRYSCDVQRVTYTKCFRRNSKYLRRWMYGLFQV